MSRSAERLRNGLVCIIAAVFAGCERLGQSSGITPQELAAIQLYVPGKAEAIETAERRLAEDAAVPIAAILTPMHTTGHLYVEFWWLSSLTRTEARPQEAQVISSGVVRTQLVDDLWREEGYKPEAFGRLFTTSLELDCAAADTRTLLVDLLHNDAALRLSLTGEMQVTFSPELIAIRLDIFDIAPRELEHSDGSVSSLDVVSMTPHRFYRDLRSSLMRRYRDSQYTTGYGAMTIFRQSCWSGDTPIVVLEWFGEPAPDGCLRVTGPDGAERARLEPLAGISGVLRQRDGRLDSLRHRALFSMDDMRAPMAGGGGAILWQDKLTITVCDEDERVPWQVVVPVLMPSENGLGLEGP